MVTGASGPNPLPEIRAQHELSTHSATRGELRIHRAGCSCGVTFEWYDREALHAIHVDAMILQRFQGSLDRLTELEGAVKRVLDSVKPTDDPMVTLRAIRDLREVYNHG